MTTTLPLTPTQGNLPATKSAGVRLYGWGPTDSGPHDGILTLVSATELDQYAVYEDYAFGAAARAFEVEKLDGSDKYRTILGRLPALDLCSCPAGRHGRKCKHTASLRALVAAGHVENPAARPAGGVTVLREADVSYCRESVERRLRIPPGSMTLDELARLMSLENTEEAVSVRDNTLRPVPHSRVYFRGDERTGMEPSLKRHA